MHATFSPGIDMAYVYLTDASETRAVHHTEPLIVDLPRGPRRLINLDFDAAGRLLGIEVEGAKHTLPASLLAGAERPRGE
jgi:uncharacterized protein YuzE